jgi:cytochrome b561
VRLVSQITGGLVLFHFAAFRSMTTVCSSERQINVAPRNNVHASSIVGTSDCAGGGAIKPATQQETFMFNAANATCEFDHPSARVPIAPDTTGIEFARPRSGAVMSLTSGALPAYTVTARALHWVTALVIALMIPLGVIISNDWGGRLQNSLYGVHESLGALLIPVIMVRLGYRLMKPPLPLPQAIPALQQFAAHLTHLVLYALLVAQPLVGWIAISASGMPVTVLGLFPLPLIAPESRAFSEQLFLLHGLIGLFVAGLIVAHIGAALYHHVVRKDRVLMRMITG